MDDTRRRRVCAIGTQCADSIAGKVKSAAFGVGAGNVEVIDAHIRVYQWRHWCHDKCRWVEWLKVLAFCNSLSQAKKGTQSHPPMQPIVHSFSLHWTSINPRSIYIHSFACIWNGIDIMHGIQ